MPTTDSTLPRDPPLPRPQRAVLLLAALFYLAGPLHAAASTWTVALDGTGDFSRIQDAIAAASTGDRILVRPGTYHGAIDMQGMVLELLAEGGALETVIDADGSGSAVTIPFTPGGAPLLRGFTITNGNGTIIRGSKRQERYGGGIFVELAFPRIEDCRIVGNVANVGAGAYVVAGAPAFVRCTISRNSSGTGGGVAVHTDGGVLLEDCAITENDAVFGGAVDSFRGLIRLSRCSVLRNRAYQGGAFRIVDAGPGSVRIESSLIARNRGDLGGAFHSWQGSLEIRSTTIADNDSVPSASLVLEDSQASLISTVVSGRPGRTLISCTGGAPMLDCVDLWPEPLSQDACSAGISVFSADPLFCDPGGADYSLRSDSPCLPGQGPAGCSPIGAFGIGCDVPVATRRLGWGEVKALFR